MGTGKGKAKYVQVYDFDTQRVTTIPAENLAPGMTRVKVEGIEGDVWVDGSRLKLADYRHPPFDEDVKDYLRAIKAALDEVYPLSLEQWEDGFRRDQNVEQEIAIWVHIAQRYTELTRRSARDQPRKQEIFKLLVSCANNPREHVLDVNALGVLSRSEAESVIDAFFGAKPN